MTNEEIVLAEVRSNIKRMPEDDRIRVECIASTLRNILRNEPLAQMALALVGAELAAS